MGGFSRDFLGGVGKGDAAPPPPEQPREEMVEEVVELSLGLSLGGRFGAERKGDKLPRSSSVAALQTPAEVPAQPALPRTSSLPVLAEASQVATKQGAGGGWGSCREGGGLRVEHVARLPASGSPSSASSEVDLQQGSLMRSSSLPAVFEAAGNDELKKRKEAQSLKRLEVKKKRIERRNSLTSNTSKEAPGQIPEETNAHADKLASSDEAVVMNNENHSSGKHPAKGLPPKYQATVTSQDSLSAVGKKPTAFKGTAIAEEHSSSSSVPSSGEAIRSVTAPNPPPPSSLAPRTATLGSREDQSILGGAAATANSTGDVERRMMQEMPGVFTKGLPNGNRIEGFLYKYRKGEDVRIVCICHGSFLTPSEFVEHAGAGKVDNPLRHIVVNPTPNL